MAKDSHKSEASDEQHEEPTTSRKVSVKSLEHLNIADDDKETVAKALSKSELKPEDIFGVSVKEKSVGVITRDGQKHELSK